MNPWLIALVVVVVLILISVGTKIVKQYERGVVLRFGKLVAVRNPGFNLIIPFIDRLTKVSLRIVTFVLEPQEVITKDNVTVKVDAVVYFMVIDPVKAIINVEEYKDAIIQLALTTLRSVLGQSDLDELLA
ncbi:MAG: SPFH domain-containing protein, partial [Dehalococcoidia bacterium]|nr:SPFH domain-containing protein [Dehalococcoidia bacterium]